MQESTYETIEDDIYSFNNKSIVGSGHKCIDRMKNQEDKSMVRILLIVGNSSNWLYSSRIAKPLRGGGEQIADDILIILANYSITQIQYLIIHWLLVIYYLFNWFSY